MSEYREHCPLLPDELSDDDQFLPRQYRCRSFSKKNRVKASLKGAAAIIKHWPDHWTTFVTYWWIGVGMISLTTFIIYNSFVSITLMPKPYLKPSVKENLNTNLYKTDQRDTRKSVFMHLFSNNNKEIDLEEIIPTIRLLTEKYPSYTYRLIIVLNDTSLLDFHIGDERNNEIAMNALWTKKIYSNDKMYEIENIRIEYISLSRYLDNSAISKFWRELSEDFIKFMIRSIAVWEKGGIAFNPIVLLSSNSQSETYIDKLHNVLSNYENSFEVLKSKKQRKNFRTRNKKLKPNNIQDIINAMENDERQNNTSEEQLTGMENKINYVFEQDAPYNFPPTELSPQQGKVSVTSIESNLLNSSSNMPSNPIIEKQISNKKEKLSKQNQTNENTEITTVSLLPKFLDFLFHRSQDIEQDKLKNIMREDNLMTSSLKTITSKEVTNCESSTSTKKTDVQNKKNGLSQRQPLHLNDKPESYRLTIDLKGNLIASNTVCHAFIGSLFKDVIHYKGLQNITEFIISEMSRFCHGPCSDIDVM